MNYIIVSDSSSDLLELADVNYATVPLKILTDEKEYIDDAFCDVDGMVEDLKKYRGKSKSSCPNFEEYKNAFGDYDVVFAITITSNLSGSCNAASLAMNEYLSEAPDRKGCVFDSLSTGPESVLIIQKIVELIKQGLSFEEIEAQTREYMKTTHLFFSLDSLNNLANNGRVSHAVAKIAGTLGIRAVGKASNIGTLELTDKVRGFNRAVNTIYKNMLNTGYTGGKIRIHHCQNADGAQMLIDKIKADFPDALIELGTTGALCSFYAESGGLLVAFEGAEK